MSTLKKPLADLLKPAQINKLIQDVYGNFDAFHEGHIHHARSIMQNLSKGKTGNAVEALIKVQLTTKFLELEEDAVHADIYNITILTIEYKKPVLFVTGHISTPHRTKKEHILNLVIPIG